jgi:hypothetical protein
MVETGDLFALHNDVEILIEAHDRRGNVVGEAKPGGRLLHRRSVAFFVRVVIRLTVFPFVCDAVARADSAANLLSLGGRPSRMACTSAGSMPSLSASDV